MAFCTPIPELEPSRDDLVCLSPDGASDVVASAIARERRSSLRLILHDCEAADEGPLPLLATSGDIREAIQFLKKRPTGITAVEAMGTAGRRAFEPRKIAAYEFWGIVEHEANRLKLSDLGWQFAQAQEHETRLYLSLLDSTESYRSVLVWAYELSVELVTHSDVATYWEERFPRALDRTTERSVEGNVVCFFHLCQAADLGTVTIGKRGQPARLRLDRENVEAFIKRESFGIHSDSMSAHPSARFTSDRLGPVIQSNGSNRKQPVFVSHCRNGIVASQVKLAIEVAGVETKVSERKSEPDMLIDGATIEAMRACDAALFVVSECDFVQSSSGEFGVRPRTQSEIASAWVLFDRRVLLLWDERFAFPDSFREIDHLFFDGRELGWTAGMQLIKLVSELASNIREIDPVKSNSSIIS